MGTNQMEIYREEINTLQAPFYFQPFAVTNKVVWHAFFNIRSESFQV